MSLNYFKDSQETVSAVAYAGFCQRRSLSSISEERTGMEIRGITTGEFSNLLRHNRRRKTAAPPPLKKNCDASSTNQSNNFGVRRKRFKQSTPGSNSFHSFKSTTNEPRVISYWWLIAGLTVAVLLIVCEILLRTELENCHFRLRYSDCRPWQMNAQQYQHSLYIAEKYI